MIGEIRRGGVYYARTVEGGERPVVVVSWDALNRALRKPVVCEVTSTARDRALDTVVALDVGEGGLDRPSWALCHEIATIAAEWLRAELGLLSGDRMAEIEDALRVTLDLGGRLPLVGAARP